MLHVYLKCFISLGNGFLGIALNVRMSFNPHRADILNVA